APPPTEVNVMTIAELTRELDQSECDCRTEQHQTFEQMLRSELRALADLESGIRRWDEAVRRGEVSFDFQFDRTLTERHRKWVFIARLCLGQLELEEARGFAPELAAEF